MCAFQLYTDTVKTYNVYLCSLFYSNGVSSGGNLKTTLKVKMYNTKLRSTAIDFAASYYRF